MRTRDVLLTAGRYLLASLAGLFAQAVMTIVLVMLVPGEAPDMFGAFFLIGKIVGWLLLNALPVSLVAEALLAPQSGAFVGREYLKMGFAYYCASFVLCGGWVALSVSPGNTEALPGILGGFALYALVDALCGLVFWWVLQSARRRWRAV